MLKKIEDQDSSIKKDIIINGIMRSKGVYLLVSQPKVGKSMLALQLADSITNGKPFLGHKVIASPVLYISTESDFGQLQERLKIRHTGRLKIRHLTAQIVRSLFLSNPLYLQTLCLLHNQSSFDIYSIFLLMLHYF